MKYTVVFVSLFLSLAAFSADNVINDATVSEIRTYDSRGDQDFLKMRISLNGSSMPGINPDITDNGADIPCRIFASTPSVLKLLLQAKLKDRTVKVTYVADGHDGADCKVRHITLNRY